MRKRKQPYTELGIKRINCFRCKTNKAVFQWQICADGNVYRGICTECDIELNEMVLKFMNFPNWKELIDEYRRQKYKDQ